MSLKKTAVEAAGLIHHVFADVSYAQDSTHPVYRYATSQFADRQLIINDPITHGVAVINSKQKVTIISLPQYHLDMATGQKSLVGLLGNNCSYTTPVVLTGNFTRDVLTLAPTNPDITNQPPIGATSKCEVPDGMYPYQVLIILPLFGDCEIEQGSIEDDKVYKSLCAYHPIGKLWADAVRYTAKADSPFQLVASDLTPSLANLAPEGTFVQEPEIDLSRNDMILERLEQVKEKNREAYYERNPE